MAVGRARLMLGELRLKDGVETLSPLLRLINGRAVSRETLVNGSESEVEGVDSETEGIESEIDGTDGETEVMLVSKDIERDVRDTDGRSVLNEIDGLESDSDSDGRSVLSDKEIEGIPVLSEGKLVDSVGKPVGTETDGLGVVTDGRLRLKSVGIEVERLGTEIDGRLKLKLMSVLTEIEVLGSDSDVGNVVSKLDNVGIEGEGTLNDMDVEGRFVDRDKELDGRLKVNDGSPIGGTVTVDVHDPV